MSSLAIHQGTDSWAIATLGGRKSLSSELESDGSELDDIRLLVCLFSREDHGRLQLTRSSVYR